MTNGNDRVYGFTYANDVSVEPGLTKREYFAAMADLEEWKDSSVQFMESVVGEPVPSWNEQPLAHLTFYAKFNAIIKCIKADALITELNKQL
jgi:hypothetical protein